MPIFNIQGKPIKLAGVIPLYRDRDVSNLIDAIAATGTTLNLAQRMYIVHNIESKKAIGVWDLEKACYLFVGGTAASHALNAKDPRNLDAAFRLTYTGGITHSNSGMLGNGSTGLADTKLIPATHLSENSTHLSYFTPTNNLTGSQIAIGVIQTSPLCFLQINITSANYLSGNVSSILAYTPLSSDGLTIGTRTSSSLQSVFYKGVKIATTTFNGDTVLPSAFSVYLLGRNADGTVNFPSVHLCGFASIGSGLTDTEAIQMSQIVNFAQAMRANF